MPSISSKVETTSLIDREIGARLRLARQSRGLTQSAMARAIGVTFQQIQKYERGANRVSVSTLILLARRLDVAPTSLLGDEATPRAEVDWFAFDVPGATELLEAYGAITTSWRRQVVRRLAAELALDRAPKAADRRTGPDDQTPA